MIVTQDLVCNSVLSLHLGRGVVSSIRMVSLVRMVSLAKMVCLVRKESAFRSKCKQLRPLPWVRGQWQWCYDSNMSIIIIIIIINISHDRPFGPSGGPM